MKSEGNDNIVPEDCPNVALLSPTIILGVNCSLWERRFSDSSSTNLLKEAGVDFKHKVTLIFNRNKFDSIKQHTGQLKPTYGSGLEVALLQLLI